MSLTQYYLILLIILQLQFQLCFALRLLFNRLLCSALVISTLGACALCTFWARGTQLICTWYRFPFFLWIQYRLLATAWYPFPRVGCGLFQQLLQSSYWLFCFQWFSLWWTSSDHLQSDFHFPCMWLMFLSLPQKPFTIAVIKMQG